MTQIKGDSSDDDGVVGIAKIPGKSGVFGFNAAEGGNGVAGISENGNGVYAKSKSLNGVYGDSETGSGVHGHSTNQIGVYGIGENGDGVMGVTKSPEKCGVFGNNESTDKANSPSGSGVFGLTKAENATGVFGANNNPKSGRGVQGNGAEAGVGGFSEAGVGVIGQSNKGDGAQGFTVSNAKSGIFGRNSSTDRAPTGGPPAGNGVFGFTDVPNASGVCGVVGTNNTEGAGVTGIGKTAGRFFGNVEVTGSCTVQGINLIERILKLEKAVAGGSSGGGGVVKPNISVTKDPKERTYTVDGHDFKKNTTVYIRVVDSQSNPRKSYQSTSDQDGTIKVSIPISEICVNNENLIFSANDGTKDLSDITGVLWSNFFTITCG